jgi:hypothetical protein
MPFTQVSPALQVPKPPQVAWQVPLTQRSVPEHPGPEPHLHEPEVGSHEFPFIEHCIGFCVHGGVEPQAPFTQYGVVPPQAARPPHVHRPLVWSHVVALGPMQPPVMRQSCAHIPSAVLQT